MKKTYAGKVNNYFSNLGVAEIIVEAAPLKVGQHILIIGPTTGVVEMDIPEIRVDLIPAQSAAQGVACSSTSSSTNNCSGGGNSVIFVGKKSRIIYVIRPPARTHPVFDT